MPAVDYTARGTPAKPFSIKAVASRDARGDERMPTRRMALGTLAGGAVLGVAGAGRALAAGMAGHPLRRIPQKASARVIIDNDFAGDPDALVALAHQLLTPKTRTVLVTCSALAPKFSDPAIAGRSAAEGKQLAEKLIGIAGIATPPPVAIGSEHPGVAEAAPSPAARAIVAEAMREDQLPLVFTCGGPLTNLAAALRLEPAIAKRMTVVWIGGGNYPAGGWEYNLATDLPAARAVIEQSAVPLWQVPQGAYRQMQASVAEMTDQLASLSPLGAFLYDRFTTPPAFIDVAGAWPLGDSPTVLLTALSSESSHYTETTARRIGPDCTYGEPIAGRTIRIYDTLDARLTFSDFTALMRLHAAGLPG